jgi:hypothetical protein
MYPKNLKLESFTKLGLQETSPLNYTYIFMLLDPLYPSIPGQKGLTRAVPVDLE